MKKLLSPFDGILKIVIRQGWINALVTALNEIRWFYATGNGMPSMEKKDFHGDFQLTFAPESRDGFHDLDDRVQIMWWVWPSANSGNVHCSLHSTSRPMTQLA